MGVTLRRIAWATAAVVGLIGVGTAGAWAIDNAIHRNQVMRNVELDGRAVGGLHEEALADVVADIAATYADRPVTIEVDGRVLQGTAGEFGLTVDEAATARAVLETGRDQGPVENFASWAGSFVSPQRVPLHFAVVAEVTAAALQERPQALLRPPVEPSFAADGGRLQVKEAIPGLALDAATVSAALLAATEGGEFPSTVAVDWSPIPADLDEIDVALAVEEAQRLVAEDIAVELNGRRAVIPAETARRWLRSERRGDRLTPVFDEATARRELEARLADLATEQEPPVFQVVDGELTAEVPEPAGVCCQAGVAEVLMEAARTRDTAQLAARPNDTSPQQILEDYGIVELVGEFTTRHACCQSRVQNIHRMADLVRGVIIEPGETFSINEHVGERTRENGFLPAGAIEFGRLVQDVGGGVSQFATTMFNAAFFAGLDFVDYQSHSIYFSRYPYGREATLGFPEPDLAVANNTPYAVLVWTDYTDSSITVQMWSTPYFQVEETGQYRYAAARCTRVETYRKRTAPDGRVIEDEVLASYRPGEGLDCFGNPTPRR